MLQDATHQFTLLAIFRNGHWLGGLLDCRPIRGLMVVMCNLIGYYLMGPIYCIYVIPQTDCLGPVFQRLNGAIQRLNYCPLDKYHQNLMYYPVDSYLTTGWCNLTFEQLRSGSNERDRNFCFPPKLSACVWMRLRTHTIVKVEREKKIVRSCRLSLKNNFSQWCSLRKVYSTYRAKRLWNG